MTHTRCAPQRRPLAFMLSALGAAALTACGGGGSDAPADPPAATTQAVRGVVADGPLSGATVCYDLNDNGACDPSEPSGTTDADGRYGFDIDIAAAGQHAVIATVPATAVDKDTGLPVGTAFTLKTPASGSTTTTDVFVSPLTTLVADVAASQGVTPAEAAATVQSQLGLSASPLANFVAATDGEAAKLAKTVNTVIIEVVKLAEAASVPADAKQALVASVTTGDLSTLAALVASSTASTPSSIASQVTATLLAERNLSAETVAEQASTAKEIAAAPPPPATPTTGPFTSVRRFTFTDANNHYILAFIGDNTPGANGRYLAHEVRRNMVGGVEQPFNRNTAYWNKATNAWEVCVLQWQIVDTKPQTATTPQDSLYCGASRSTTKTVDVDVAGRKMADVVREIRASSLRDAPAPTIDTDATGLPVKWGPDPALLGDAVFPAEARFSKREQTSEVGDTERYSLTDKPRVVPASGSGTFRHAVTFDDVRRMRGNLAAADTVVTNANTIFIDDLPTTQTDSTLGAFKRYRAAFAAGSNAVRFYACDVVTATNNSQNCVSAGDGTLAITTQGDARVLRFDSGYPAALITGLKRQRLLVERSGTVFGGYRDLERKVFQQRPNTVAWEALRTALAIPALEAPTTAPATSGPFEILRSFSFTDSANFTARVFAGDSSALDAQGNYSVDDRRVIVSAGVEQPFARNTLYWTGTEWYDCPSSGVGALATSGTAPFTSIFCRTYVDDRANSVTVTLAGRLISDVVQDIRWYSSKDGTFDYANWGPSPGHADLVGKAFPAGATMEYRGTQRRATPLAIATGASSQVRVPPADSSVPFNTWPFATTLEQFIGANPGDINGGPLNGSTAFFVHGTTLPTAPSPELTTALQYRVAFDASGQKARFYSNNISATTGFTTNYVKLLDTTYTVETVGGVRLLRFAAMPTGFESEFLFARLYAERDGGVWYAFKDTVLTTPTYSIRLNKTAKDALAGALGIN